MTKTVLPAAAIDQATTLRALRDRLPEPPPSRGPRHASRVLSVTSGKGGVGKTVVTTNLAVALARLGCRVLVIDADLGLANVDVMLGLAPASNLNHFFAGERSLEEILVEGPQGIRVLPAGSGVQSFLQLSSEQKRRFLDEMDALHDAFDLVLIDTEAGISDNVTYFNVAAQEILVVTAPEPTAITDAYALMKLLSLRYQEKRFKLLVNSVRDEAEGLEVYRKLTMVSARYLDIALDYLGCIPFERRMREAISRQKTLVELHPQSGASAAFAALASQLAASRGEVSPKGSTQFFWRRLLAFGQGGES